MSIERLASVRSALRSGIRVPDRPQIRLGGYRQSAVLVPVIDTPDEITLLLTKRTDRVETHKGQVAFPGGMSDEADADVIETALREVHEELGISPSTIRVAGILDDLATPTGFIITPVVGILDGLPPVIPNAEEVAEVFQVPMLFFADPERCRMELREVRGTTHEIWYYDFPPHVIWGATAKIIRLLLKQLSLL